jgi:hypothetical protein
VRRSDCLRAWRHRARSCRGRGYWCGAHADGRAPPSARKICVNCAKDLIACRLRRRGNSRCGIKACVGIERGDDEVIEPNTPLAAGARGERELDRGESPQLLVVGGPPRKGDLPFFAGDRFPILREGKVRIVGPPDVLAGRIDQLELERVGWRNSLDGERELVVGREDQVDRPMNHRVSAVAVEIEIEPNGPAVRAVRLGMDADLDAVCRRGCPLRHGVERVQYYSIRRSCRSRGNRSGCRDRGNGRGSGRLSRYRRLGCGGRLSRCGTLGGRGNLRRCRNLRRCGRIRWRSCRRWVLRLRLNCDDAGNQKHSRTTNHPLTLPAITPWM